MKSNLKKLSRAALVCFFLTLLPSIISAEMLRITVNYAKGVERSDQNRIDVKDGYWNFPVLDVPEVLEKGKYAIIIEGYNTTKPLIEDLAIVGMNFTKKDLLLPAGAILTIENRENFQRTLSISQEGDKENVFLTILPNSSLQRQFSNPGNYVVADANFPWNVSFIKVLKTPYLLPIHEGANRIDLPDIVPGSYTIKIYYGTKWIYQEDFMVVSNAERNLAYKIKNGVVTGVNSYSTSIK